MGSGAEIFNSVINQGGTPAMLSNTLALRPAFGYRGRIFIATDTREIYRDTGTSWELIGSGGGSVNIYNSDGTLTALRTVNLGGTFLRFDDTKNGSAQIFVRNNQTTGNAVEAVMTAQASGVISVGRYGVSHTGYKFIQAGQGYIYSNDNGLNILQDGSGFIRFGAGGPTTAQLTLTNLGRLLFRTTVDAGYDFDVNGTSIFRNSATFNDYIYLNTNNRGISVGANNVSANIYGGRDVNNCFQWGVLNAVNVANTNRSFNEFSQIPITFNSGTNAYTIFNINPSVNNIGGSSTIYGIRYNPNLISSVGTTNIAIQTDSGIVDHYDRLNLTTSDFSSRNAWTLHARLRQTLTPGADQAGAGYYVGGLHIREISASGNNTFGNATINAGGASSLQIDFTGSGTLTASQSGLRAFSGHQIFNTFGGSASGTITHFAGMQILGLYNRNSGSITPTITNAYGLIVNNLNDYSHTFTLTNRWGVYQTGGSDNNYFAGKLLVGTTTVTARQVHISGNIELTTTLAGTAGGSSGQHLSIWANGNEYKIALLNP